MMRVWNVINFEELTCFNIDAYDSTLTFSDDSLKLLINEKLLIILTQTSLSSATTRLFESSLDLLASRLRFSDDWVTSSSQRILWLSFEFRSKV